MAQDEMGKWGYYSHCDPCYTVFHKETESFTEVWTAYDASPAVFLARYRFSGIEGTTEYTEAWEMFIQRLQKQIEQVRAQRVS